MVQPFLRGNFRHVIRNPRQALARLSINRDRISVQGPRKTAGQAPQEVLLVDARATDCRRSSLRPAPQHRQKIQADQMRDALFLLGRLLTPELSAEYAGCRQFRRESAPGQRSFPGEWHLPEQVTGFFGSACDSFHVAPRMCNRLRPERAPCLRRTVHIYSNQNRC